MPSIRLGMAVAALVVPTAFAAAKPDFGEADRNGDDRVSLREAKRAGVPIEEAEIADIDDDGKLTRMDWKFVEAGESSGGDEQSSQGSGE